MTLERISPQQASELIRKGGCEVVDVRTASEHGAVRVAGARHMPVQNFDADQVKACGKPVVLFCQSGARAEQAAGMLGGCPSTVYLVEGGMNAWEKAGLPVQRSGRRVVSLERQVQMTVGAGVASFTAVGWFLHPIGFLLAGAMGLGLFFAGVTGTCALGLLIARMPWNKAVDASCTVARSA